MDDREHQRIDPFPFVVYNFNGRRMLTKSGFNLEMMEDLKKEILNLLDAGIIYPISNNKWVSMVQVVIKKIDIMLLENNKCIMVPTREKKWVGSVY